MAIVCGTDFSDWGKGAQMAAAALAARLGEDLWLVHVLEPDVEVMEPAAREQVRKLVTGRLEAEGHAIEALTKHAARPVLLEGKPHEALRTFAKEKKARLLVVGSAGHGAGALVRLGGVSERVASATEVPVLVVRDGDIFSSWARGEPLKVLVALDETRASAAAIEWIRALRKVGPVDVVVGRVYYADEAHERYGLGRRFSYTDPDPVVERLIERDLKRQVPELEGKGELLYRAKLGLGRVADHLLELAEAERCQVVVVGSHSRRGLARMWSVSSATLHLARMSVAVVPPSGTGTAHLVAPPRLKRVMVSTDLSDLGNQAIPWAYALVPAGGEVTLAHVTLADSVAGELVDRYLPGSGPQSRPRVEAEVAARLRALVPVTDSERGVVTHTEVLRASDAARALVEAAERLGVDAIVMSSHGRSGLARTVLGSVSEEVMKAARRPVFIVR